MTSTRSGRVKGEPSRFLSGHNGRVQDQPEYVIDEVTGCWVWQRGRDRLGYGRLRVEGKRTRAHRHIYERHQGPIPKDLVIDHLCKNKFCVNPEHMEPVTQVENMRRAKHVKLTMELAQAIREATGKHADIAAQFGTNPTTVSRIRRGLEWSPSIDQDRPSGVLEKE